MGAMASVCDWCGGRTEDVIVIKPEENACLRNNKCKCTECNEYYSMSAESSTIHFHDWYADL